MKKIISFITILIGLPSVANAEEARSPHTEMIQAACASLMRDVIREYGKSFFCYTDATFADNMNAALLTENLEGKNSGLIMRFSNVYYENPNNPAGAIHYSYNSEDYNAAILFINSGHGLTVQQQSHLACRNALKNMKQMVAETDKKYAEKEFSPTNYESIHKSQLDAISNIAKQCPN